MQILKITYEKAIVLLLAIMLFSSFKAYHKFYVSITKVEYVKEKQAMQFISRIFIDDFEHMLQQRFDESIVLNEGKESEQIQLYVENYLKRKIKVVINGEEKSIQYIGKEYEKDIMYCYYEIPHITEVNTINVTNEVLFDMFDSQQNIVRLKINDTHKTFVLIPEEKTGVLKFN
ncbi:MAG: peptidase E [Flavobacteriaceae bacterium]|nr:peptidase E [Flavobacteriaceae bacterium]